MMWTADRKTDRNTTAGYLCNSDTTATGVQHGAVTVESWANRKRGRAATSRRDFTSSVVARGSNYVFCDCRLIRVVLARAWLLTIFNRNSALQTWDMELDRHGHFPNWRGSNKTHCQVALWSLTHTRALESGHLSLCCFHSDDLILNLSPVSPPFLYKYIFFHFHFTLRLRSMQIFSNFLTFSQLFVKHHSSIVVVLSSVSAVQ